MSVWWRPVAGAGNPVNASEWFSWPEDFDKIVSKIQKLKAKDVYVTMALYDEDDRTPAHATVTNDVWMDSDTFDGSTYRVTPSWTIQSSSGRWQHHWTLIEPTRASLAAEASHRMSVAHAPEGADPSSWTANKIMRVPTTTNTGHDGFPEMVSGSTNGSLVSIEELLDAYQDVEVRPAIAPNPYIQVDISEPEDLPDYLEALDKLSPRTLELATTRVHDDQDRSRLRYRLLCDLMREPISFEEALAVAWHAPATSKWTQEDERGFAGLTSEALKAQAEVAIERGDNALPPTGAEQGTSFDGDVSLLTEDERKRIAGEGTFIKRYLSHNRQRMEKLNEPYYRSDAWIILSLVYSDLGFIPRSNGKEGCNLYHMELGETTTGKTFASKSRFQVTNDYFGKGEGYDIGGNASASALGRMLAERDKKVSFFNKDEAHGTLKTWMNQDWTTGMLEDLAELYDGKVPPQLRTGNWDGSGKSYETQFVMKMQGTPDAMIATLTRDMFATGFLARFQWIIGNPREVTLDSLEERDSNGDEIKFGYDAIVRQMSVSFRASRAQLQGTENLQRVPITISHDAAKRLRDAKWELLQMFEGDRNWDILEPSLVRLGVTMRKCATLLAMDRGSRVVELVDILLALEACEEWVANLAKVVVQISASDFERAVEAVFQYLVEQNGKAPKEQVMRRFKAVETRFLTGYIQTLALQGRVREKQDRKTGQLILEVPPSMLVTEVE